MKLKHKNVLIASRIYRTRKAKQKPPVPLGPVENKEQRYDGNRRWFS